MLGGMRPDMELQLGMRVSVWLDEARHGARHES